VSLSELIFTVALTPQGSAIVLYAGNDPAAARRALERAKAEYQSIGIWEKVAPTVTSKPGSN